MNKIFDINKKDNLKNQQVKKVISPKDIATYVNKNLPNNDWIQSIDELPKDGELLMFENKKGLDITAEIKKCLAVYGVLGTNEKSNSGHIVIFQTKKIHEPKYNNIVYNFKSTLIRNNFNIIRTYSLPDELLNVLYSKKENSKLGNSETYESENSEHKLKFIEYITFALRNNVSDIHFEIRGSNAKIRMRKLGEMYDYLSESDPIKMEELIRCIYQAHTDEKSRAQSFLKDIGQVATINLDQPIDGKKIRIRYQSNATHPTGFDVILRILIMDENENQFEDLIKLGYSESQKTEIEEIVAKPQGALIIAGTTGSGKSTTLKNLLMYVNRLHSYKKKIYTIEDPPEYLIPHVTQIPINRDKLDIIAKSSGKVVESYFTAPINDLLRSDPDIVMIGEIRDAPTADGIKKITESGHQVFSTVHTGSALGIIERLHGLDLDTNAISNDLFLSGLIYQKLVPIVCPHCSTLLSKLTESGAVNEKILKMNQKLIKIGFTAEELKKVRVRASTEFNILSNEKKETNNKCKYCEGTGLTGREVCAEVIKPDLRLYDYFKNNDISGAKKYWLGIGYHNKDEKNMTGRTLLEHAIYKVKQGKVCPFDVESTISPITDSYDKLKEYESYGVFNREKKENKSYFQSSIEKKKSIIKSKEQLDLDSEILFEQEE